MIILRQMEFVDTTTLLTGQAKANPVPEQTNGVILRLPPDFKVDLYTLTDPNDGSVLVGIHWAKK